MNSWKLKAIAAVQAGDLFGGLESAFNSGATEERERWQRALGHQTPEEAAAALDEMEAAEAEAAKQAQLQAMKPKYPGKWIEHDGEARFVRGYQNGRYGYWREGGEFVDVPRSL